jgi:hypothetical protein
VKSGSATEYAFDYDLSSNLRTVQVTGSGAANVQYVIDGTDSDKSTTQVTYQATGEPLTVTRSSMSSGEPPYMR